MDYKEIIVRLKRSESKTFTALSIKRQLRELSYPERTVILNKLEEEKSRSDNSDVIEVINDIISEFNPKK